MATRCFRANTQLDTRRRQLGVTKCTITLLVNFTITNDENSSNIIIALYSNGIWSCCSFTLKSERLVGMTLCPARGNHVGTALYQQLVKVSSDGFISACIGTTLKRMPCLPRSPR